jgi:ABC-2 type transport system permease protein
MKEQLRSEVTKLRSTRSVYWVALAAVGMALMAVTAVSGQSAEELARPLWEQQFWFLGTFTKLLIVVVGIRIVTDEYRFGTILPTFVYEPRRWKVVVAKAIVGMGAGLIIAVIAQAALIAGGLIMFSLTGNELVIDDRGIQAIAGSVLAGVLWGGVGVAIGAIVRNQVAAIVGSFVWLMALEEIVAGRLGDLADYLPGSAGFGLVLAAPDGGALWSALVLAGYAIVGTAAGTWVTAGRDVT